MKKYSVNYLRVVKIVTENNTRYLICKYNELTDTYTEVLTNEKIKVSNKISIEALSNYNTILSQYGYKPGQPLMLDKKTLLQIYIDINSELTLIQNEKQLEKSNTKIPFYATNELDQATLDFFPKTGAWYSNCFRRPDELRMENLPCHLRDDIWLAKMLKKDQKLYYMSHSKVLDFVRTSQFFQEKRHEYELEIVKWQIQWIVDHGENWICDENLGGDFVYITPKVDLGVRKGIVDTLSKIGMNKTVIEEGIEKFADLWRERFMKSAFRNEYEPVFFSSDFQVEPAEEEHKQKWLKMRRYEYYQRHKESVDLYGFVSPDMLMSDEEVAELKIYLDQKHQERKLHIDEINNAGYGTARKLMEHLNF